MLPVWKLKRELSRIKEQVQNIPRSLAEPLLRYAHDQNRASKLAVFGCGAPQSPKFCVLLVYQPRTFAASVLRTCDYMTAKGYNVVVVANGGLPVDQRSKVTNRAWRLIERPNFGYDFGGYRDAVHFLQDQGISPTKLILMNDSIWFPMWTGCSVIENLETSPFDLTGLLLHVPARNEYAKDHRRLLRKRKLAEHIESYVTMVPQACFDSDAFRQFWDGYRQTDSKLMTIKRGEIGFSKAMKAAGFTVGALSRRSAFLDDIAQQPDAFLVKTLKYAAYSDPSFEAECQHLFAHSGMADWRAKVLDHIARVVEARRFNASFCWATEQLYGTSFVKKHPDRLFQIGRMRFLEAVENGDLTCDNPEALAELRAMVAADRHLFTHYAPRIARPARVALSVE
ncbi:MULTISPECIES: rhamnan synthesis F family protein [unclassified Yoonia]|uniref:rhamnan synthesis F family protein n=1 Tax=unclassified Yoonia TaxID=2629118 RepID=UPI002AFDE746|nr:MULTISPECIES: rhamnan synthesis F family protein [unclassified Yoonia]